MKKIRKLSGNYAEVHQYFSLIQPFFANCTKIDSKEATREQIQKDLGRTPFFGSDEEFERFASSFLANHQDSFTQGDAWAGDLTELSFLTEFTNFMANLDDTDPQPGSAGELQEKFGLAYINEQQQLSGCSYFHFKADERYPKWNKDHSYWIFATVNNSNGKIEERQIDLYISDNMFELIPKEIQTQIPFENIDLNASLKTHIHHPDVLAWAQTLIQKNGAINLEASEGLINYSGNLAATLKHIRAPESPKPERIIPAPRAYHAQEGPQQNDTTPPNKLAQGNTTAQDLQKTIETLTILLATTVNSATQESRAENSPRSAEILDDLAKALATECETLLQLPAAEQAYFRDEFQKSSQELIETAQKNLPYDQVATVAVVNTILFILSGALLYLAAATVKYAMTGEFLLFSPESKASKALEPIREELDALANPGKKMQS